MKRLVYSAVCVALAVVFAGCDGIRPPEGVESVGRKMTVTGYCSCGKCCSWRRNWRLQPVYKADPSKKKEVGLTASGVKAKYGTIAADTSIYPFGTVMFVEGYGFGRVEDRGGKINGHHIDLYFGSHGKASQWGKKTLQVKVWFPKGQ